MEVYNKVSMEFIRDQTLYLSVEDMTNMKMMIESRPSYPSNKLTFSIADFTKDTVIQFFNIALNLNEQYDVDVVLEDSKRNNMNSFL